LVLPYSHACRYLPTANGYLTHISSASTHTVENCGSYFASIYAASDANPTSRPGLSRPLSTTSVGNWEKRFPIKRFRPLLRSPVFPVARFLNRVPGSTALLTNTSTGYPLFHAQRVLLRSIYLVLLSFLEASFASHKPVAVSLHPKIPASHKAPRKFTARCCRAKCSPAPRMTKTAHIAMRTICARGDQNHASRNHHSRSHRHR
jgi:hypothetical protein